MRDRSGSGVEFVATQVSFHRSRSFGTEANGSMASREQSVEAVVEHELGMSLWCCLDAKVAKHRVGWHLLRHWSLEHKKAWRRPPGHKKCM